METVPTHLQPIQQQIFFLVLVTLNRRNTIIANLGSLKQISAARNWFDCVAKHNVVMTFNQTNSNITANVSLKERLKTSVMARFQVSQIIGRGC